MERGGKARQRHDRPGAVLSEDDRAAMPQYEKHQLARNIHTFFENVPQEQPHPYPFGFDYWDAVKLIEPQLDDPARVEEIYQMMVPVWEATPQDDRMYKWRQTAFENLSAFRQGTFTLFAEHKEPAAPAMPPEKPMTWAMDIWGTASLSGTGWRKNTGITKRWPISPPTAPCNFMMRKCPRRCGIRFSILPTPQK